MDARKPVLVIHPGALGDVVLAFPALAALARRFGLVHLLCQGQIGKAAERLGVVDRSFPIESARFAELYGGISPGLRRWLAGYRAVLAVSVSREPAAGIREHFAGEVLRILPRPGAETRGHTADFLLAQAAAAGWIEPRPPAHFRDLRAPDADPTRILVHPGAGSPEKRWPLERFFDLAAKIAGVGMVPCFFIGPAERNLEETIRRRGWPFFATENLSALADRLRTAGAFVGNDSGVSHLAAFIGVPTVAVFGPTDPGRWAPRGRAAAVVAPRLPSGFPPEGRQRRPFDTVSVSRVIEAMRGLAAPGG